MKPDWKDAPEWANWLAMDSDGEWWWFEGKPLPKRCQWLPEDEEDGRAVRALDLSDWEDSLQERPK